MTIPRRTLLSKWRKMSDDEREPLLTSLRNRSMFRTPSIKDEEEDYLAASSIGERLPYSSYTSIDWLHEVVKSSARQKHIDSLLGVRGRFLRFWDKIQGWIAVALIGLFTAVVAYLVDIAQATVFDWKLGYCEGQWWLPESSCCRHEFSSNITTLGQSCLSWHPWSPAAPLTFNVNAYFIYVVIALAWGIISASLTLLTYRALPTPNSDDYSNPPKALYMAGGSGIPEIKTILSGFVIRGFLSPLVLAVKAVGAVFATGSGMCLGKEGPFVHISACVGNLVSSYFQKYESNEGKKREILSASVASGLSVAFGAPVGGVLFAMEEISYYFPPKVLWRAFLCSMVAAITLRALNPFGTGKLVLFATRYGNEFIGWQWCLPLFLGISGGVFGAVFIKMNYKWSKWFRSFNIIKNHPVLEVAIVVTLTGLLQWPNQFTRVGGDELIREMLVDCQDRGVDGVLCIEKDGGIGTLVGLLTSGIFIKLLLTSITFGAKVPSGIIIPALDAGALYGRLLGVLLTHWTGREIIAPGVLAMIGAAAFLGGVSRMTVSLTVIMFELTGELDYMVPHMIAILGICPPVSALTEASKWVGDYLQPHSVYSLSQALLGHPFYDYNEPPSTLFSHTLAELIPPQHTMKEITLAVEAGEVPLSILRERLGLLHRRGLTDAGLMLVSPEGWLRGYITQTELEYALNNLASFSGGTMCRMLPLSGESGTPELEDLSVFVDRTPLMVGKDTPVEVVAEVFGKVGCRYVCIVEDGKGVGVLIKKRFLMFMEEMSQGQH